MDQLSPEQREVGQANFHEAVGFTRRDFLQGVIGAGAVSGAGLGAMYFGYSGISNPVRIGVIGTGDEGNVLIGACTPEYVDVVAISDIRPSAIHRAFHGDWSSDAAITARPGLIKQYGYSSYEEARKHVKVYDQSNGGIGALLDDPDIQGVIIALPLHLHAPIAVQALLRGKHVLTEKLMAHNVAQCKAMGRIAKREGLHLATGHQRHYSVLYDNAVHLIRWGLLGQLHHIRAQWHRGNLPGGDSWQPWMPGGETDASGKIYDRIGDELNRWKRDLARASASDIDRLEKKIAQWTAWDQDKTISAEDFGYVTKTLRSGRVRTALEELCRWRLWERTGGGLMAELGSHQLDAASIFCSALRADGSKARPICVHATGGRTIFPFDREVEDHVYCMYDFPGPEYDPNFDVGYYNRIEDYPPQGKGIPRYEQDPNKRITVTYSSINGNGFGGYGEVVMGTKGTLVLETEQEVMLYSKADTSSKVGVKASGEGYALDTQASGGYAAPAAQAAAGGPVSRGYTEQIEHWAYCIANPAPENRPRCYPDVAMADAVIALTTNVAIAKSRRGEAGFVLFKDEWFDRDSNETPDNSSVQEEMESLQNWKV
jgi:predicted dehydrogenase